MPIDIPKERQEFVSKLTMLKHEAMTLGLYRTMHLLEIPIIEIGWELQGPTTTSPDYAKKRQKEVISSFIDGV